MSTIRRRMILVVVSAAALVGCGGGDDDGSAVRDETGTITEAGSIDPLMLRTGDCLADSADGSEVNLVEGIPCADAHRWEVFYSFAIGEGADGTYPGDEIADLTAREECDAQFESAVGAGETEGDLAINYIRPTVSTWADGDRAVHCLVGNADGTSKTGLTALPG